MDLVDGLRVFVAAVEAGSLSGAGQRLGMSPKLVSKQMAALEARLGARLLQRTTRRLGLTPAGESLIARAPDWLDTLDDFVAELNEAGPTLRGTLRVAAPLTFGEVHILPLVRAFRALHPGLAIDLRLSDSFADLAAEGIDIAIRMGALGDSALVARRIGQTRMALVAAPAYLARRGAPQRLADLHDHDCIHDSNMRGDGSWPLLEDGQPVRLSPRSNFRVNSVRANRDLALAGEGVAFCLHYMVAADLAAGTLVEVLPGAVRNQDIWAVHLGQRRMARRTRAFIDFLATRQIAPDPGGAG